MKKTIWVILTTLLLTFLLVGCGSNEDKPQELVISTYGLSDDKIEEDVFKPFEQANNVKIITETGTTSERYTKFESNKNSNIDIIELSQSAAAKGYEKGIFEKIDYSKIPNAENLIDSASGITSEGYGPPFTVNSIGIIYDKEAAGMEINSWEDLWSSNLKGKISIPEITTTFGPAMVHIASEYKDVDIKSDNGEAAFEALDELKENIVKTYAKSSDLANMFTSGEIAVAVVGDFAIPIIQGANPDLSFIVPESGTYANFNTMEINANSENKELAYKYINWRISEELQSITPKSFNESPINKKVVLDEETAKNLTYGKVAENAKSIDYSFVNPLLDEWIDKWNRILNY